MDFWKTPNGKVALFSIKSVFIFFSFFFLFWIIFFLIKSAYLWNFELYKESLKGGALPKGKIPKKWQEILSKAESRDEANNKLAIIEADVLLDDVLKRMGFVGDTMSDKLSKIKPDQFKAINELKAAHQVRNNILYDPDFKLSSQRTKEVIGLYEKVLQELDII
jgi:hypothetical protein